MNAKEKGIKGIEIIVEMDESFALLDTHSRVQQNRSSNDFRDIKQIRVELWSARTESQSKKEIHLGLGSETKTKRKDISVSYLLSNHFKRRKSECNEYVVRVSAIVLCNQ